MLAKIIEFSLRQRMIVILSAIMLFIFGTYSFLTIPIDAFPDVSSTQVKIILKAPGMAPEEVENRVVRPLELELLGLPNQKSLRSLSKYGIADITIDFNDGTDIYLARNMVNEKLSMAMGDLPSGVIGGLAPIVTPLSDMFMFTIESTDDSISEVQKRQLLDFTIRPALRNIKGVADVNRLGGYAKAIAIVPDFDDMARLGITISDLEQVLEANLKNDGAGRVSRDGESFLVKVQTGSTNIEEIKSISIITKFGFVRVGNFCDVIESHMTRLGLVTIDGKGETTQGLVLSLKGANSRDAIKEIKIKMEELKAELPESIDLRIFYDRSQLTQKAVNNVIKTLAEAVVLIVILLFLFLGDVRAAVAVSVILPLAIAVAFVMMSYYGISANLMSLGGLAIAVGILVDSAVVTVENAFEKLSLAKNSPKLHTIYRACKEISVSVFSGILIIIIFFVPILTLEGLEGKFFVPLAQTIVFALLGSLILSMTVIPVISSFVLKTSQHHETKVTQFFHKMYAPMLDFALTKTKFLLVGAVCFLVFSFSLFPFIGSAFMPTLQEGDIVLNIESSPSISLEQSRDVMLLMQKELLSKVPEIKSVVTRTGADEVGLDPAGPNQSDAFISFKPKDEWEADSMEEVEEKIRSVINEFKGMNIALVQPIDMRISEMLTGVRGDLAIKIFGLEIDKLNELSSQIVDILKGIQGSAEVFTTLNKGVNYLHVTPQYSVMANTGISSDEFTKFMRSSLEGIMVTYIPQGFARIPVIIRQDSDIATDITKLKSLQMSSLDGNPVPISSVANIKEVDGPVQIQREQSKRYSVVRSNVIGRDLGGFVEEAKQKIAAQVQLPEGYSITYGGQFENQQRANKRLSTVIPLSILAIFFILFFTFKSIPLSLLILLNIPFAVTGGLISLFISGEYISVPASVGFIALFGIAVLNGVVMVGYFLQLLKEGYDLNDVVVIGAKRRLRPVLMTAFIAGLGLIPMLLSTGVGSEVQKPLAVVVLGGLVTSSMLTLLILPPLFRIVVRKFGI
ncbi:cobalt-zinc-cadmium resistance protein CzcA [Helicobacter cinaedi PAGU611]|uniref:efflux RND transporter permease subunit n=1 Tax=Helicobacter cinaedi TaxID=213 RepID=UPI00025D3276|nr:efflux RND transporter permease subunit [Helicobacter cinaedi]AWK61111.1 CusA/CzcA family heavy metal efflux RND transporter [Helicobacter cinaedi]QOQ90309.1 CusA/CzcA family heavy metal efflux RND transporter [Helicobacter cinaedi]QOQ96480.1 CusA/CzcA family heavy metal efflux RND transporter [Helicobacter cinaedi]BAM11588.1 cobalt-zinc-cadmium resistance protein CzcA [Helicobacter cinaedi PAGU611]BBB19125.1 cobalt-zinc-cadmium resistance protein CzcA [Helicobacter cinaedi]